MRPVNIPFDQHIGAQRFDAPVEQGTGRKRAALERDSALAERHRRDVELDVVCELRVPECRVERTATLDQDALHVARLQFTKRRLHARLRRRNYRRYCLRESCLARGVMDTTLLPRHLPHLLMYR